MCNKKAGGAGMLKANADKVHKLVISTSGCVCVRSVFISVYAYLITIPEQKSRVQLFIELK